MRKIGYLIGGLIIILLALAPLIDGYFFKQNYLNLLTAMNQESGSKINLVEYHLGWMSSDAKTSVELKDPIQGTPIIITITQHIMHGPLVHDLNNHWNLAQAQIQSHFLLPDSFNNLLFGPDVKTHAAIIQIDTLATFRDEYYNQISMPAINLQLPNGSKLTWQGLTGDSYLQLENHKIYHTEAAINFGGVTLQTIAGTLTSQNILIQYDVTRNAIGLMDGSYAVSSPGFAVTSMKGNIDIEEISFKDSFSVDNNNFFNNQTEFSLKNLNLPEFRLNSMNIQINENNLSAEGVLNYINTIYQLKEKSYMIPPDQIQALFTKLITTKTTLNENAALVTAFGSFVSDGQVYWPNPVQTFDEAVNNANFKINVRISASLINHMIDIAAVKQHEEVAKSHPELLSGDDAAINLIDQWGKQNLISDSASISLKDLVKMHLSTKDFATNVDEFILRKDIPTNLATELKMQYAKIKIADPHLNATTGNAKPQSAANMQPITNSTAATHTSSMADVSETADDSQTTNQTSTTQTQIALTAKMKKQIDDLVKQGYLKQDKDDYITTITRENGVIKINGLDAPH